MRLRFLLTGEGSSDLALQAHLEQILIEAGFDEIFGQAPDLSLFSPSVGRTVREKISALSQHFPETDVIFYHRDADKAGSAARFNEITEGIAELDLGAVVIPIIPVCELETWLLADQEAIKTIAGNKDVNFRISCMPPLRQLERDGNAKATLLDALCEASRAHGRHLEKFKKRFGEMRGRLAMELDPNGPVNELPSYRHFRQLISEFARGRLTQ